jgi:hypothetical protein
MVALICCASDHQAVGCQAGHRSASFGIEYVERQTFG